MFKTPYSIEIVNIVNILEGLGGESYLVGGCVRDFLLGLDSKDYDLEVFKLTPNQVETALTSAGYKIDSVGKSFGVFKVKDYPIDISFPRKERKVGNLHTDFEVSVDSNLSLSEAAKRRDFTINAIYYDPIMDTFEDPFHGMEDLYHNKLDIVDFETFKDDPLRVLRAAQFIARFGLIPSQILLDQASLVYSDLISKERIWEELKKLLLKGKYPSKGFLFLDQVDWLETFLELERLKAIPQDKQWHPEGNVLVHTLMVLDQFAEDNTSGNLSLEEEDKLVLALACLCHDFGKTTCTQVWSDKITSKGHENAGEKPTRWFLKRFTNEEKLINKVVKLVTNHMVPTLFKNNKAGLPAIKRLVNRVDGRIDLLCLLAEYDQLGRGEGAKPDLESIYWLLDQAEKIGPVEGKIKPIVNGRDIIDAGLMEPGIELGKMIKQLYEFQLDGKFTSIEEGLDICRELLKEEK